MIKLIISDMDGTLLNSKDEIDPEFWELYKNFTEKGIIFLVASGRQYYSMVNKLKAIKKDTIFIAENGSYIVKNEEELYADILSKKDVSFLLKEIKNIPDIRVIIYGKKSAYSDVKDEKFIKESEKYFSKFQIVNDLENIKDDIFKISINHHEDVEKNIYPIISKYNNKYKIVLGDKTWLDIMKLDVDKGKALKKIQKELNISFEETMAFGDYLNDYGMLKNAKYSIAMGNAHPELKKIAYYITDTNDNKGFIKAVKKFLSETK